MGTSDAQVEQAIRMQLGLPSDAKFLLRDGDGDVVPLAASLPNGQHFQLVLQEDLAPQVSPVARTPPVIRSAITSPVRNAEVITQEQVTSPSPPSPAATKRRRLDLPTEEVSTPSPEASPVASAIAVVAAAQQSPLLSQSVSSAIAQFVETFTRPIANDDNVNFIPNTGRFALYELYSELVRGTKFHPKREDVFYKMTSLHGKVDRQRVNRYYQCQAEDGGVELVQCKPLGKGVLLRRYREVESLDDLEEVVRMVPFVSWLGLDPKDVVVLYVRFLDSFTPIAKSDYRARSMEDKQNDGSRHQMLRV
ncbi:unnamed protein product [Phytophthora lilii]|uniref:Unnamed protein product n=1 Tax=Phytophthora lilii TaxID=2077276 RepID=A0A9W6TSU2_9STRA|nr:unnamed protein product [Phytophthora lilii]